MRAPWSLALCTTAMFGVACAIGPRAEEYPAAVQPRGTLAVVTLERAAGFRELRGELLAAEPGGLLLLVHDAPAALLEEAGLAGGRCLVRVTWDRIRQARFERNQLPGLSGGKPGPERRAALARASRFPQGVGGDLETRLLEAYRQSEIPLLGS